MMVLSPFKAWRVGACLAGLLLYLPSAELARAQSSASIASGDETLGSRVEKLIASGNRWLAGAQQPGGWWSTQDHPAVTAFALMALKGDPSKTYDDSQGPVMGQGYAFLDRHIQPDGGIYHIGLVTYNTAICMMALSVSGQEHHEDVIRKARQYLIGLQSDFGQSGVLDHPMDGGIGYGSSYDHSDMGNTLQALEALYHTQQVGESADGISQGKSLDYAAAIRFLQHCQNLSTHNPQDWVSDDPAQKGGFVYYPGSSKAGEFKDPKTGRVALRSYGSISYGGMLAYAYAKLDKAAPQVQAVFQWLQANYTLEENPAMGLQGLFYYYHTLAKALTLYEMDRLALADGRRIDWRSELVDKLSDLQLEDGSWLNDNGRWWERDPALVTSYVVLTLERIHHSLK